MAGLFAAGMSTLDSSMTTLSTLVVTDLYQRFAKTDDRRSLLVSRLLMLLWGMLGIAVTVWGSLSYMGVNLGAKWLAFAWDPMMVGVIATATVVVVGYLASRFFPAKETRPGPPMLLEVFWKKDKITRS